MTDTPKLFDCLIQASSASSQAARALQGFLETGGDPTEAAGMAAKLSELLVGTAARLAILKEIVTGVAPRRVDG